MTTARRPWRWIAAAVVVVGLVLACLFAVLAGAPAAIPDSVPHAIDASEPDREAALLADVDASARASVAAEREPDGAPATEAPSSEPRDLLTGTIRFADGTIPPQFRFVLEFDAPPVAPMALPEGACTRKVGEMTRADGTFEVRGLCPGTYRARLSAFGSSARFELRVNSPARGVELVFPGHLVLVDVIGEDGEAAAAANVRLRTDAMSGKPLVRATDDAGRVAFVLETSATTTLDAFQGWLASESVAVDLLGASSTKVVLTLAPPRARPELRIAVTGCAPGNGPVHDYCLTFDETATGTRLYRVCSEDVGADGVIDTVRPGTYTVRAVPRYLGAPVMYHDQSDEVGTKLVVEEGRVNELAPCVRLGGRIALEARERAPGNGPPQAMVFVSRVDERDGSKRFLSLREPDATGVTVSHILPFGVERTSEDVLDEGEHLLSVSAKGYVDQDVRVFVRAGETAKALVLLDRAP